MEGGEGGKSSRSGGFCFGGENSMPILSRGGSNSLRCRELEFDQAPVGLNGLGFHGDNAQLGSGFLGNGLPYENNSVPNSVSNMKTLVDFPNINPPNSYSFLSQVESFPPIMNNNFYSASALPCNSMALPATSQPTLMPSSCLSANFKENEHSDIGESKNHEGHICNMRSRSIQSSENSSLGIRQTLRQHTIHPPIEEFDDDLEDTALKLIMRKELSNSDVGTVGRIVLPKKEAEANLPPLTERDGIILEVDDLALPVTWKFKYRFWPNNKSRMYIMESTGEFVKAHGLQAGDYFIIYRSLVSDNYVVRGKKAVRPPKHAEVINCHQISESNMKADCLNQMLIDEHENGDSRQLWLEQEKTRGELAANPPQRPEFPPLGWNF
ncbi:uncharacterized protein A4U43_C07F22800 [Asparagus officinalis]|uniref:TF-B3 domain-containing protein n=1 Tax=Asparagus officinalis TaxID=4686 RepID=A0A5P1EE52_ASPOF|nr:B3 domain-containing protein IDEF1-like [Asparagus officinalis]ONK64168.1 uncharacterized protein A4U43_C07F22800 [Asparagus officinalis]